MGDGIWGLQSAAELGSRGALTESRTTNCPLSSLFLCCCPLPAARVAGWAGRWQSEVAGPGWFESRDSGSRRGQTGWRGRDQTGNGLTGCGRPKVPAYIEIPERQIYKWPWPAHGNRQSHGMGNGKLDGEAGQGTEPGVDPPSGHRWRTMYKHHGLYEGEVSAGLSKEGCLPRRWWLLGTPGRQRLKLGTYACADVGLAVSGIDRAHGA